MTARLGYEDLLGHLADLPGQLPVADAPSAPAGWDEWIALHGAGEHAVAAALLADLGPPWSGYDAMSEGRRAIAEAACPAPGDARAACEALAASHAFESTVLAALLAARPAPVPAASVAAHRDADPVGHALACDGRRPTSLPQALAARFHHRCEVVLGRALQEPDLSNVARGMLSHAPGGDGGAA